MKKYFHFVISSFDSLNIIDKLIKHNYLLNSNILPEDFMPTIENVKSYEGKQCTSVAEVTMSKLMLY